MAEPRWSLQKAKDGLSTLVDAARRGAPQLVIRHGRPAAVVLSVEEYRRLKVLEARGLLSFAEQLLAMPQDDSGFGPTPLELRPADL